MSATTESVTETVSKRLESIMLDATWPLAVWRMHACNSVTHVWWRKAMNMNNRGPGWSSQKMPLVHVPFLGPVQPPQIDSSYFQLSKHGSYKSMSSMFSASHGSELSHSAAWSTVMIIGTAKIYTEYRYMPVLDCPRLWTSELLCMRARCDNTNCILFTLSKTIYPCRVRQ